MSAGTERLARAALACVAEPGDPLMGALLREYAPAGIVAALLAGRPLVLADGMTGLRRAISRWRARLSSIPDQAAVDAWTRDGLRFVVPSDAEWPGQLDVLGDSRPWGLWVRGNADLRFACLRSVALVGTRAATAYGAHVCTDMAVTLAEHRWTVISGGAYGIDSCAHRGALAGAGVTIAVLAGGVDVPYPRGHHELFEGMLAQGALVSEWPPGRTPTRPDFLMRNRVIAALSRGTVVVEAAARSGALNTARHARDQNRPLMAVPGPVTSVMSAGCHQVIREWGAVCITSAADVMELLAFPGDDVPGRPRGPVMPYDCLDAVTRRVLDAVPARGGYGPARIAGRAGVDFGTVMTCLGALAAGGFVERCEHGWRLRGWRLRGGRPGGRPCGRAAAAGAGTGEGAGAGDAPDGRQIQQELPDSGQDP